MCKKKLRSRKKYYLLNEKKGRFCIGNRVGFVGWMVGWLDGWMVGRLDGWTVGWLDGKEIFEYTPDQSGPKTRATRGQDSLRSEICILDTLALSQK